MKRLVWGVLIVCTVVVGGCDRAEKAKQRRIEEAWQSAVGELAKRHGAVVDWESRLPPEDSVETTFSIEASRALMPSNSQPVLLIMDLRDVAEKNGSYTARFDDDMVYKTNRTFRLIIELTCTREQAELLLQKNGRHFLQDYAVVARIAEVSRPRFELTGTADSYEVELSISDVFLAKGSCIDWLRKDEGSKTGQ